MTSIAAQEIVELKLSSSNKLILKFVFKNGSVSDPAGKEGLTTAVPDGFKIFCKC
jgi:zinc protease